MQTSNSSKKETQTSKTSRTRSSEGLQRSSPATPKSTRGTKTNGSESDSPATHTPSRISTDHSPKVVQRRSPRSPATEKKRPSRMKELEVQLNQVQEDLKKAKDQLNSSEAWKKKAQQEAEEAKTQLAAMSAKLEESQLQLVEFSAAEEDRLQELRRISQDRDRAWQSELEAIQKQHSMDSAALGSAMSEMQRLKVQLEKVVKSEAAQAEQSQLASSELQDLKQELAETMSTIENLKFQLGDSQKAEANARAMVSETQEQLEAAKSMADTLRSDSLKFSESLDATVSELNESRARVSLLEETVRKLEEELLAARNVSVIDHEGKGDELSSNNHDSSLATQVEQLKSDLEAAEIKRQEEQIQSTMQIQSAHEMAARLKNELEQREAVLESELKNAKAEIFNLKTSLIDKETELQNILDVNKELEAEKRQSLASEAETELENKLMEMKANLMDKETELQSISEENEKLKQEMGNKEVESQKSYEAVIAEVELAKAAERDALLRLGYVTEEADKSSRRAARVTEQLDAAQAVNTEMETELRKLRVQSDQWRKAAEAAAAVLTTGNNGRPMERTGSLDTDYNSIAGKLMSSPFSDDLSDDSPKKKNNTMLKKIGGLWKKGPK
ncbi:interactor of constitutive active ROPs 2, chloroplastic isoform X1 [Dioscorea cayenensis subsp. rotundata]|uniref:Interactor of constitutive active ROPs 2, chloroplastic isoform X1 n=1 Tax=Dioscorea cayennensis subsp. rotundata TaxID=55577 RepID=A0AB40CCF3_DIOCR|nr:interactor of constitutive active ROPs 2, chloroplastic isoform X1 [Dioscorea cayenensis subsp. rotundata]